MLDLYFQSHQVLHRLRSGPAGPFLDGFAAALDAQGYAHKTSIFRLIDAAHLGLWSARREIPITSLDDQVLARFDRHLPECRCMGTKHRGYPRAPFRVRTFVEHLRRVGVVAVPTAEPMRAPLPVQEYYAWMRQQRGLTERTLVSYVRLVGALIDALGEDPTRYDAPGLRAFVFHRIKHHERHSAPAVTTPVRSFLRYLVAQGRCSADLIGAVPSVPRWRLAKLPPYLPAEDVERIIESCDVRSPSGLRDRAMLLLLARLGVRAGDVVGLRLADIDWKQARLRIVGKGRRETWLPLPQDAGDAILAYMRGVRPRTEDDHVFLTLHAPIGPLRSNTLSSRVARAMQRAGVEAASHGAHLLRHSLASRMLREGATLDLIGAVLRHRSVETTALYSKVDVDLLRGVAQPWPGGEVAPC